MSDGDPATKFQGLQAPYQPIPVETRLNPPIPLRPVDYSAIQNALSNLPQQIMQSPINPVVRAQLQAETARYREEQRVISETAGNPKRAVFESVGPGGLSIASGAQSGPAGYPGASGIPAVPSAPAPAPAPSPDNQAPSDNAPTQPPAAPITPSTVPSQQGFTPASGYQGSMAAPPPLYQGSGPPVAPNQPPVNQPSPQQQGPPPLQQGAPAEKPIVQAAPPNLMPMSPPNQVALQQWQNSTQGNAASAKAALDWARNNHDTDISRAVYMPNAGPGGSPAFAFSGRKGGTNVVPLSQMVQHGFAPEVLAQNTSVGLNTSQALQQPSAAPAGQPPLMPQGQFNQQLAAATNVPSMGGPSPQDLSAQAGQGAVQQGLNIHRNNPSNAPQAASSVDPNPIPPGQVMGRRDPNVDAAMENARKTGAQNLPLGPDGVSRLVYTDANGLRWYGDPSTSGNAYLIYNSTPWSQMRMEADGKWTTHEVLLPNKVLDKWIYENGGAGFLARNPATPDKINWAEHQYWLSRTDPVQPATQAKLEGLFEQTIQSQRLKDATSYLTPGDYGWFRRFQNELAANQYQAEGTPLDWLFKAASKTMAGGKVDPRLKAALDAYSSLMAGAHNSVLSGEETGELSNLKLDATLPDTVERLNHNRMSEFNRYVAQALSNNERIDGQYVTSATQIRSNGRVNDGGNYFNSPPGQFSRDIQRPTPQSTPGTAPGSTNAPLGSQMNPIPVNDQATYNSIPPDTPNSWYRDTSGIPKRKLSIPAQQPVPAGAQ
jgi:hypothetical protein